MSIDKKHGSIWSYNPARLVGTIIQDETNLRFFFHASSVRFGPREITISARCTFLVDPKVPPAGKLPVAREIKLLEEVILTPVETAKPLFSVDAPAKTDVKESL
jgi:hypothetical protein